LGSNPRFVLGLYLVEGLNSMNKFIKIKLMKICKNHYLNMLVIRCIKVITPSKRVFGGYIGTFLPPTCLGPNNTRTNISSKHRLLGHYHLSNLFLRRVAGIFHLSTLHLYLCSVYVCWRNGIYVSRFSVFLRGDTNSEKFRQLDKFPKFAVVPLFMKCSSNVSWVESKDDSTCWSLT
jgi:hypothetical protein